MRAAQAKQGGFELSLLEPVSNALVNVVGPEPQHSVIPTAGVFEQSAAVEEPLPQVLVDTNSGNGKFRTSPLMPSGGTRHRA
jgi:hypothetical protein